MIPKCIKQWVLEQAQKLRHKGVDIIIDHWNLALGEDAVKLWNIGFRTRIAFL